MEPNITLTTQEKRKVKSDKLMMFVINSKSLLIMILVIIGAVIATNGLFLRYDNITSLIRQSAVMSLMGLGFTAVLTSGSLDLSVGHMLSFLSVVYAYCALAMPFALAVICGLIAGGICGLFNGLLSIKLRLMPFVVTLATGQMFRGFAYIMTGGQSVAGLSKAVLFVGQGTFFQGKVPFALFIIIFFTAIMAIIMYRTKLGRHIVATGGNLEAAKVSGVNTDNVKLMSFIIMGVFNALAAVVVTGRISVGMPFVGDGMEMDAIAAVVIGGTALNGGKAKVVGTVLGCLILTMISNMLNLSGVDSFWQWVTKGIIIIFAIFVDSRTEEFFNRRRARI